MENNRKEKILFQANKIGLTFSHLKTKEEVDAVLSYLFNSESDSKFSSSIFPYFPYSKKITNGLCDTRTRLWTYVPMKKFFDPLLNKRKDLKKQLKSLTDSVSVSISESSQASSLESSLESSLKEREKEKKKRDLNAEQEIIKLIINCVYGVYGVLASPYFPIGNTILANNITAKARG